MDPFRIALLATICAVIMCCAGAVQLLDINRTVVADGASYAAAARPAPSASATLEIHPERGSFAETPRPR